MSILCEEVRWARLFAWSRKARLCCPAMNARGQFSKPLQFLGVSAQTVYLWVEAKRIPHLRIMGRNIRFLRSELEPFRASFRQEVEKV